MNRRHSDPGQYRIARPDQVGYSFDRLESDFRAEFSAMPTPADPMAVDVTPETLGDRDVVAATRAHIETWKRNRAKE